ncbi:hypothetical protein INT43_000158 [Umbelopsis isabellina]|uniref:Uncharacterized protein n=1 Tax=Mortierella isabellina TaxID=91625 RepID=A0A8H7PF64_MORIS|nr:hypothetical protein INT43_000158 [Umbelopsis isabellina]
MANRLEFSGMVLSSSFYMASKWVHINLIWRLSSSDEFIQVTTDIMQRLIDIVHSIIQQISYIIHNVFKAVTDIETIVRGNAFILYW